ncbi:MAG: hypothetical protein PHU85_00610 [Phycisphaerae bacterium]|nr:hypothetical protein [Phycisphaerae bacterium]
MKITVATDDGEVLGIVENVEGYNLAKPLGVAGLIDEIRCCLRNAPVVVEDREALILEGGTEIEPYLDQD